MIVNNDFLTMTGDLYCKYNKNNIDKHFWKMKFSHWQARSFENRISYSINLCDFNKKNTFIIREQNIKPRKKTVHHGL